MPDETPDNESMNTAPENTPPAEAQCATPSGPSATDRLLGLVGAVAGAVLGYFTYAWMVRQGFYAIAIPGMLAGVGTARLCGKVDRSVAITAAVIGLLAGLLGEWMVFPFRKDASLVHFLTHIHQLKPLTQILIVLGGVFGYVFSFKPGCGCRR